MISSQQGGPRYWQPQMLFGDVHGRFAHSPQPRKPTLELLVSSNQFSAFFFGLAFRVLVPNKRIVDSSTSSLRGCYDIHNQYPKHVYVSRRLCKICKTIRIKAGLTFRFKQLNVKLALILIVLQILHSLRDTYTCLGTNYECHNSHEGWRWRSQVHVHRGL